MFLLFVDDPSSKDGEDKVNKDDEDEDEDESDEDGTEEGSENKKRKRLL